MKYYVLTNKPLSFKQKGKVVVPSKAAIEANLSAMLIQCDPNEHAMVFTDLSNAQTFAKASVSNKSHFQGIPVIEVSFPKTDYTKVTSVEGGEIFHFVVAPYNVLKFEKAHLGHIDNSFKGKTVDINVQAADLLKKGAADKSEKTAKTEQAPSSRLKNLVKVSLATAGFAAAAYASIVNGLTGVILSGALRLAVGFTACAVVYIAISAFSEAVSELVSRVYSKLSSSKDASKADKKAEDKAEATQKDDLVEAAVSEKSNVVTFNKDAKSTAKPVAKPAVEGRTSPRLAAKK